mmetsp:Transcript_88490/g.162151  ORF Transcript_88490/g.162151 Transcript_88490/m.162151 type:complete len:244 (-) Transcript_88490:51-782(-)
MICSEKVHDKITHILRRIHDELPGIHCKIANGLACVFQAIANSIHCCIEPVLCYVLAKYNTTNCQATNSGYSGGTSCNFGTRAPSSFAFFAGGSVTFRGLRWLPCCRHRCCWHWHKHCLSNFCACRHADSDESTWQFWMWNLNCGTWCSRRYVDDRGWSCGNQWFARWLPVFGCSDRALFLGVFVDLHHSPELVDVILSTEMEFRCWETRHESALQDLVLISAVILPVSTQLYLKVRHHGGQQ